MTSPPETGHEIRISHMRAGRVIRVGGVSSRLLTTMAIVRSNADKGRDYISNFEPFATDRLKAWAEGHPVAPDSLARVICEEWGVPSMPAAVGKILLRRAEERGEVVKVDDAFYPNPQRLSESSDLAAQKNAMVAKMNAVAKAVVEYAKTVHGLDWSEKDATDALERLTEEFGADLALAKRRGGLAEADLQENEALAVVHGFARRAAESEPTNFQYLEEMVQGTMLVNAVYFQDVGHVSNRLKDLRAYLDTTPVLRALGLAADPVCDATRELIALLRNDFKVRMFVFPHTVDEIAGILGGVAGALRRGRRDAIAQGPVSGRNREAIDALVKRGCTAGEIESMRAELENRIRALGIDIQQTPPHVEKGHIDEKRFDQILDQVVSYRSKGPREKDLKSLAAVDRIRGSSRPRDLSQANAIFVTANSALVRAAREFFGEADRGAPVPHAIHETALTAQLWVRAPHPPPDLPRKLLIADCYAALNPSPELWERWVQHIVRLEERGDVSEEQVQNLIYHQQAKSKLFEVTHGDPDAIGEETVAEVLDRFESELRRPAEQEAVAERAQREAAEAEGLRAAQDRDSLREELDGLTKWKKAREATDRKWRERLGRARTITGYIGTASLVLAFVLLCIVLDEVQGKLEWATAVTLLVSGASASWAWATRRSWKFPLAALVFAGAVTALFVNVFSIVPEDNKTKPPAREKSANGRDGAANSAAAQRLRARPPG
jgi:hypothetical protein